MIKKYSLNKDEECSYSVEPNEELCLLEFTDRSVGELTHKTSIKLGDNSSLIYFLILFEGKRVNKKIEVNLMGNSSKAQILGVYLGHDRQRFNFNVVSNHEGSDTNALTWINGILFDRSASDFDGLVKIVPDLHRVNSYLANHVLVLGDQAQANAIPSLEIESNDVKCSHEATVGQVDDEHLFYLMSRGLTKEEAVKLLVDGYLNSVVNKITDPTFKKAVSEMVTHDKTIYIPS